MKKIKVIFLFILFAILSFTSIKFAFAEQYFSDNFDSLNNWDFVPKNINDTNSWKISNGLLVGEIGKTGVSYLFLKNTNLNNYKLEFNSTNISGVDQEFLFNISKDKSSYFVINSRFPDPYWGQDSNLNKIFLLKYSNGSYITLTSVNLLDIGLNLYQNKNYKFTVIVSEGKVNLYLNGNSVLSYIDNDISTGGIGFLNWGGDYPRSTVNNFDNLIITSIGDSTIPTPSQISSTPTPTITITPAPTLAPTTTPIPTLTPTPTPSSSPKKKIFILPGLGASWNSDAIVSNKQVSDDKWKMTPFVNNYGGLIEILEKNGLKKDQDFFVWNYDWRKPISEIETKFDAFVKSKNVSENDEIYLVGHSLGGVVARMWGQDHPNDSRLKNIITLGSPQLGSLDTYSVWNGGVVASLPKDISSVAFQILLNLQNKGLTTNLEKLHAYAPIVKDLLPIFDNYVLKNGKAVGQNSLQTKNSYLIGKNGDINKVNDKLKLAVGIGFSTPSVVKLGDRSVFDKALGLWPDGKLVGFNYGVGDGTVLKNSANFSSTDSIILTSDHGEIVNKSLDFITTKLGLEKKNIDFNYSDNFSDSLVIFIGSPATVMAKCGNDNFEEKDDFIVIKNKNYSDCSLNLNPTDNGLVHLVLGNTNNNNWNYVEKNVTLNNPEKLIVNFNKAEIKIDKGNKDFLVSSIRSDLQQLNLNSGVKYLDKNDLIRVVGVVFSYRSKTKENVVSQRILDNLFILASINSPDKKISNYGLLGIYKDFLTKTVELKSKKNNLSQFSALSFKDLEKLIEDVNDGIKSGNYPNYLMVSSLSAGYGLEILGN